jgi:O-antigen ligase
LKTSENVYKNILGFVLTIYITSTIVFFQNYIGITYFLGALFIAIFFILITLKNNPKLKTNAVIKLYGFFSFLAILSSFWAVSFDIAMNKGFQMVYILINMYIIYNSIKIYHLEKNFVYGVLIGALVNYLFLLGFISPPFEIYNGFRAMGTVGNANVLALLMNFSIVCSILYISLYKPKRLFLLYLSANIFFALYIIFLTASKKGLFLATILLIMFLLMNLKSIKKMVIISVLVVIALILFQKTVDQGEFFEQLGLFTNRFDETISVFQGKSQGGSTGERIRFIELGVNLFAERPIFGFGIDNYRIFGRTYSHNNYIEVLVGLGLVGFIILMSMYLSVLYKIRKIKNIYLKYNLFVTMIGLILLDMAMVSYAIKMILFFIVFLSIISENNLNNSVALEQKL